MEVISRDRGGAYADGARRGAPAAQQVADRFHLLANAGEALERVLARRHADLRAAAAVVDRGRPPAPPAEPAPAAGTVTAPTTRAARERAARHERRLARYEAVAALAADGWSQVAIAARVGIDRRTVRRYVRAGAFPERDHAALAPWIDRAATSGMPEFHGFAAHVRRDRDAIDAALRHEWSNGQTEGHVNRLTAIKRARYGRARLDLLSRRVLGATA